MSQNKLSELKGKLYRSIPLIPVFTALYLSILFLALQACDGANFQYQMIGAAIGIGILSAYCITLYVEQYRIKS